MIQKTLKNREDWTSNENDVYRAFVNPELAEKMLATVIDCDRKEDRTHTETLALAMKEGRYSYKVKGSGIGFNPEGRLIDGKHTLKAVIESGKTVEMKVEVGSTDVEYVDSGKRRTMKERLVYYGIPESESKDMTPAIKNIFNIHEHKPLNNTGVKEEYPVDRFIQFLDKHNSEMKHILDLYNHYRKNNQTFNYKNRLQKCIIMAYAYHLIYEMHYNENFVMDFLFGIQNIKEVENKIIEKLRVDFIKNNGAPKAKTYSPLEVHNMLAEYFNDYAKNLSIPKKHNKKSNTFVVFEENKQW